MPAIPLYPPNPQRQPAISTSGNLLPQLLHTPSGLAIIELQGTINMPSPDNLSEDPSAPSTAVQQTSVGRLVFEDYSAADDTGSTTWMKRVHLYVGMHQRLTGEVKKLPNPVAIIRRRDTGEQDGSVAMSGTDHEEAQAELEIVEIVRWKILFSQRPEPVGN
ncbi:MAG: hypothetical protein M1833_006753 [Piccolia ochrophora]|nr:MAG: hypothetical protein M1833_006753 [Piccolia ochrophora]